MGGSFTVVGVMPPGFAFPEYAEVWTPLGLEPGGQDRIVRRLDAMARLRPGVTVEQARAEIETIAASARARAPRQRIGDAGPGWYPCSRSSRRPGWRRRLSLLLVAGLLVQLIACANVANLMLARAAAQRQKRTPCASRWARAGGSFCAGA